MGAKDQGIDTKRWTVIPRTLCFITNGDDVLLIKRGVHKRVYPGRYNGVGGHLERDEDPLTGALREITEETALKVIDLRLRGIHQVDAGQDTGILLFIFTAKSESRDFVDTDEGKLEWVPMSKLLDYPLVEDLPLLIPHIFGVRPDEPPFFAHVHFDSADQLMMKFAELS